MTTLEKWRKYVIQNWFVHAACGSQLVKPCAVFLVSVESFCAFQNRVRVSGPDRVRQRHESPLCPHRGRTPQVLLLPEALILVRKVSATRPTQRVERVGRSEGRGTQGFL